MTLPTHETVQIGDTVMLLGHDRKPFIRTVRPGRTMQTHLGEIDFDALIGIRYGEQFRTHRGKSMYVLQPTLEDVFAGMKRRTQIIYPKDLGYIALKLGIQQGMTIVESGSGSGALTAVLALMVGESGHVYSYERKMNRLTQALDNLKMLGLDHRVSFIHRDIEEGFDQQNAHALFLDVPNPYDYLDQAWEALRGGGFFGAILPTINQLIELMGRMYHGPWFNLQAEELFLRPWKTIPARIRPDDQMYGHTGILAFGRAVYREVRYVPATGDDPVQDDQKPPVE